jgi:hypothetical protein
MKLLTSFIAITILSLFANRSYAAFPANSSTAEEIMTVTAPPAHVAADYSYHAAKSAPAPAAPHNMSGDDVSLVLAILALVFGIISLAVWGGVAAILFGAAAIVLGLMGLERAWRGMSLAGFILGIVGAAIGLVSLFR